MLYHIKGEFDSAHALIPHEGKCRHLHGHTYHVIVTFEVGDGDVFDDTDLNMPIDFARLKGLVDAVLDVRDHCLFLSSAGKAKFFGGHVPQTNLRLTDGEPTAEYLARDIYKALACDMPRLMGGGPEILLLSVTVIETADQGVTYAPYAQQPCPPPEVLASVTGQ